MIIDISEHNGVVDFASLHADAVMIRAGYGRNNADKQFLRNISECNKLGIPCGVYWFSYAYTEDMARKEAEYLLAAIKPYKIEYPVAFDFEYDSTAYAKKNGVTVTADLANAMAKAFCETIEAAGYYAMVYANPDYLKRYLTDAAKYDLWLADWGVAKPSRSCGLWQTGTVKINGKEFDTNIEFKDYPTVIKAAGLNHLNDFLFGKNADDVATYGGVAEMFADFEKRYSGLLSED